jgi:uncharacterized protein with GYD domain
MKEAFMPHTETIKDVPDDKVDEVVQDFESEGAKVEKTEQSNGKWTVVATFP